MNSAGSKTCNLSLGKYKPVNSQHLSLYAGPKALKHIQNNGIQQEDFDVFLGASGGPKWFSLFGLDKYVFGEFFKNRTTPLQLFGSSAGAFRSACFASKDPIRAITALATRYSETEFGKDPSPEVLTQQARELLDHVLSAQDVEYIIANPTFKANLVVSKTTGFAAFEHKVLQGTGLLKSYVLNRLNRRLLARNFERYIYTASDELFEFSCPAKLPTKSQKLNQENLREALLASGSIPYVMAGIRDIPGSPKGMYRDGGVVDYHFDLKFHSDKLVFYPHFNDNPKAGWFDKSLPRTVTSSSYDNVLMLVPSKGFISNLPYGKIPDRTDFETMDFETRLTYWRSVFSETEKLAEDFDQIINEQNVAAIQPLPWQK